MSNDHYDKQRHIWKTSDWFDDPFRYLVMGCIVCHILWNDFSMNMDESFSSRCRMSTNGFETSCSDSIFETDFSNVGLSFRLVNFCSIISRIPVVDVIKLFWRKSGISRFYPNMKNNRNVACGGKTFWGFVINTTAYHLGWWYSLHILVHGALW